MGSTYADFTRMGSMSTTVGDITGTVAAGHANIIKGMWIANNSTVTLKTEIIYNTTAAFVLIPYVESIPAGDALVLENLNIPLLEGRSITGRAESTSASYLLWGVDEYST